MGSAGSGPQMCIRDRFKSIQDTLGNKVLNNSQIAVAPTSGVTATPISNTTTIITATPVTPPAHPAIIGGSEGNTEIKVANNVTPSKEQSIDDQIKASSRIDVYKRQLYG